MNEQKIKQEIPMNFNLDDFYTTQEQRDEEKKEKIEEIEISLIDNFKNHPFKLIENEELASLEESIKNNGLMEAVIIRPKDNGRYEMVSGHRRLLACKNMGLQSIPCRIRNLTDDEAIIYMVDSNLHREKILPSEKAFAYKMKLEALNHQGKRNDLTSGQHDQKLSREALAEESNDSERQIQRYIRLTFLIPELLQMVDNAELKESPSIALTPAVELSYLKKNEQNKKSGVPTKDIYPFNLGTFVTALNNVYGFDGANLQYGPISKVVPGFVYQDRVILRDKSKSEKFATIKKYYENGYYLAIEVAGATETEQHWVALDYVTENKIIMLDPESEATDMWKQYDWNKTTQFVYFKASK